MKSYSPAFLAALLGCTPPTSPALTPAAVLPPSPGVVTLADGRSLDSLAFPAVFEAAFLPGATVRQGADNYTFRVIELGALSSPTGKLLAGDPVDISQRQAFTQQFPIGNFPVQLALLKHGQAEVVGFAQVLFSARRVATWQLALLPGQAPLALRDSSFYCYGVDSGMGVFIDSVANRRLALQGQAAWNEAFIARPAQRGAGYAGRVYRFDGHTLATFQTGAGDGCYATYIGFDASGRVCRLLTDFGLVEW